MNTDFTFGFTDFETTGLDSTVDFPIEIGFIFTDSEFNRIHTYERMILWDPLKGLTDWPYWTMPAFGVHKIEYAQYESQAIDVNIVRQDICDICSKYRSKYKKPTIISDCANFEMGFMKKLFEGSNHKFPFHYCGWDTSLFLEAIGIGDPQDVPHRALADITLVYEAVKKGYNLIKGL